MRLPKSLALALSLLSSTASAQAKLETQVFTGSPAGFRATSTLIHGAKDAILVDAQFDLADAHRLVAFLLESKKNLTAVYVTHAHPDHYFGLEVVKQAFPAAKIVALPSTIAGIKKNAQHYLTQYKPMYGANFASRAVVPAPLAGKTLTLEGEKIEIVGPVQGDESEDTYLWIPSTKTAIASDLVFNGVFPWTAETNAKTRKAWIAALDEVAARNPALVIPGHQRPDAKPDPSSLEFMKRYLADFDAALADSKTPEELQGKVKAGYGDLDLDIILQIAATSALGPKK